MNSCSSKIINSPNHSSIKQILLIEKRMMPQQYIRKGMFDAYKIARMVQFLIIRIENLSQQWIVHLLRNLIEQNLIIHKVVLFHKDNDRVLSQYSTIIIMLTRNSEQAVRGTILGIQGRVWGSLADKTLSKMSKIKLKNESQDIFSDFAMLDHGKQADKRTKILSISEKKDTLKQSLIVGATKNVLLSSRAVKPPSVQPMQTIHPSRGKKPASSLGQLPQSQKIGVIGLKNSKDVGNEQAIAEQLRAAKNETQRYTQSLHEKQQKKRAESELRTQLQRKRFKEMKSFTYDYQGKLLSLPPDRTARPAIHVITVKPFFGTNHRALRQNYPNSTVQLPTEITNKKNLSIRPMTAVDPEKQKQQRGSRHTRIRSQSSAATQLFNYFKESSRVATGVTITDLNSRTRFQGAPPSQQNGNSRLLQFRSDFKHSSNLKQRLKLKKKQHQFSVRTQCDGQNTRNERLVTEGHKDSKIFSVTTTSKGRGWIDVRNKPLYTEHFIEDL